MGFKTEITISSHDAETAIDFMAGYLMDYTENFAGRDALERVFDALSAADRIVIETDAQRAEREGA